MSNHTDLTENPPVHSRRISLPPRTLLGVVGGRPVYNIAGGSDDFDVEGGDSDSEGEGGDDADASGAGQDDGATDDSNGDDDAGDDKPKPKPPAAKKDEPQTAASAELERTKAALKKANDDAKRHRLRNKELEDAARANESEQEKALREAREAGEKRYRAPLVKAAAKAALAEAGLNGSTDRVLKLVDLDGLSVDDDGDVIGLSGEIDRIKDEFPEFFQAPDKPRPKARPTAAGREPAPVKPKTSAEQHAMRILGRTS